MPENPGEGPRLSWTLDLPAAHTWPAGVGFQGGEGLRPPGRLTGSGLGPRGAEGRAGWGALSTASGARQVLPPGLPPWLPARV